MEQGYGPWIQTRENRCLSDEELVNELCQASQGIVVLDGYSGCGKSTLLKRLRAESDNPVAIVSYRLMLERLLWHVWQRACGDIEGMWEDLPEGTVLCAEDVDFLKGKHDTQLLFIHVLTHTAQLHPVVVTGNDLESLTPRFVTQMSAEVWKKRKL